MRLPLVFIFLFVVVSSATCYLLFTKRDQPPVLPRLEVLTHQYEAVAVPDFFKQLITNHLSDFQKIDKKAFAKFCEFNQLDPTDRENISSYYSLTILHKLFTSKTASNGSRGDILDMPYMWHWGSFNPRHTIHFTKDHTLLAQKTPPGEFSRYSSYADIDRTPYLFISDLVAETPKYYSAECDTFSTFGWCSEREMAFVALTQLLGFDGKVVAQGNHSWSEFIIPLTHTNKEKELWFLKVDNTFDSMDWYPVGNTDIPSWRVSFGNVTQAPWYNQRAKSPNELHRITAQIVTQKASARIEGRVVNYLNHLLNNPPTSDVADW